MPLDITSIYLTLAFTFAPVIERSFLKVHIAWNTVISPNFLVWKICGYAQFPQSFGWITRNSTETVRFHKISLRVTMSFQIWRKAKTLFQKHKLFSIHEESKIRGAASIARALIWYPHPICSISLSKNLPDRNTLSVQ